MEMIVEPRDVNITIVDELPLEKYNQPRELPPFGFAFNGTFLLGDYFRRTVDGKPTLFMGYATSQEATPYPMKNLKKYRVAEWPFTQEESVMLKTMKTAAVLGPGVKFLTLKLIPKLAELQAHWEKFVPNYKPCTDYEEFSDDCWKNIKDRSLFALQPYETAPSDKHCVDPDTHYWLYNKLFIPEIDIGQPKNLKAEEAVPPYVIKVTHSQSGSGVRMIYHEQQRKDFENFFKSKGWQGDFVYQELIPDIIAAYTVTVYIFKDGTTVQGYVSTMRFSPETNTFKGNLVDLRPYMIPETHMLLEFIKPAVEKLKEKGYFGFANFDVMKTATGGLYLVDINPRIAGSTQHLFLVDGYNNQGYPCSMYEQSSDFTFQLTVEEAISIVEAWNSLKDGAVVVLGAVTTNKGTRCVLSFFGRDPAHVTKIQSDIFNVLSIGALLEKE